MILSSVLLPLDVWQMGCTFLLRAIKPCRAGGEPVGELDPRYGPPSLNVTIERSHYNEILLRERELLDERDRLLRLLDRLQRETAP